MDFGAVTAGLHKVLGAAKMLSPIANAIGMVDKVSSLVSTGIDIAENVLDRGKEVGTVIHSTNEEEIKQIITELREINDGLNKQIEAS